ncbi:MAG: YgiQ family radical SAM protein [Deltaproteobacteria bacterium]|nr:YgiQ family radical SAM protein [Deltaproteobacteria bacterium]
MASNRTSNTGFIPTSAAEMRALGWEQPDVVFVSGDAYVDHPSFAAAILCRWLASSGFRVAILAQPDWRSADPWRALGRPRLFYGVSAGNMDSMINHYTANRKRRNADAYSPGGRIGLRPDRPTAPYAQRCREAYKGVPIVIGGVEASLRRIAHYDYWSDKVLPSHLVPSKADLLAFGMGERAILEIAQRLDAGENIRNLRDMRGVAYLLGRNEELGDHQWQDSASDGETVELPSYEDVSRDKHAFARMTRQFHEETNPLNARRLTQRHGDRRLVVNPPGLALSTRELDAVHELPYTRRPHPSHSAEGDAIPAWQTIKDSVQIMRGCFGGCTFCSITMHQGRAIQSRSEGSVLREVKELSERPGFSGHISDLGGPTANMYRMRCGDPKVEAICRRPSCVHPKICTLLDTSHGPLRDLMRKSRELPNVKKVHIASGIRMDLAAEEAGYIDDLTRHHVGGHLKVAPEHASNAVLRIMKKPPAASFERFAERFEQASRRAGKEQYLVPYYIASHPGSGVDEMIELAIFLKQHGYRPRQVQDFIPAPMDVATCIHFTGLDPYSMKPVKTVKRLRDREVQRALLQFFAPENYFKVRDALRDAGRTDLIGAGEQCLIGAKPPAAAIRAQRTRASSATRGNDGARESKPGYRRVARERGGRQRRRPDRKNDDLP